MQYNVKDRLCFFMTCFQNIYIVLNTKKRSTVSVCFDLGVSWPSGLAYRTQVLVLAAECGFESRPWHLCPWARHLIIIASLHPGVKWVPVRAELVDEPYMRCNGSNWAIYSPGSWDGFRNDLWALWAAVIMRLEHHLVGGYVRYISPHIIIIIIKPLIHTVLPKRVHCGGAKRRGV